VITIEKWLLLPLFLHVALILIVGVRTVRARFQSVVGGKTNLKSIALSTNGWPDDVRKLGNNFNNQFEMPTIWYAVCALLLVTGKADWIQVGLSWGFLIARLLHSYIHTGSNNVPLRMRMFLASVVCVMVMWAWFAIRLFGIG
jgi:hypothetical protein